MGFASPHALASSNCRGWFQLPVSVARWHGSCATGNPQRCVAYHPQFIAGSSRQSGLLCSWLHIALHRRLARPYRAAPYSFHRACHLTIRSSGPRPRATLSSQSSWPRPLTSSVMPKAWLPLHAAAYNLDADHVRELLAQNIDPNAYDDDGFAALHWLAMRSMVADPLPAAKLLVTAGSNVNALTCAGKDSVLSWCIEAGHLQLLELHLSSGADPNLAADEVTPLMRAAGTRSVRMVMSLLRQGADPLARAGRFTASDYASSKRMARIIEQFPRVSASLSA